VTTPAVRTPEERFEGLPGFAFRPRYREALGLRLAHLDEGAGPPVLLLHGEPTWSFLWRKVLPPLLDAGFRCVVPDLPGFGRSDKPVELNRVGHGASAGRGRRSRRRAYGLQSKVSSTAYAGTLALVR
jgi:pimeloyl-ACP methyl ester carboxylesterase